MCIRDSIKGVRLKQRRQVIDRMEATFTEAYERLLSLIRNAGGLLFQYEGNCLHALLPESTPVLIAALLARINHTIGAINSYASPHHGMPNVIRLAVGFGTLSWRIFENPLQFEYVFWSPQLDVLRENPGQPNQPYYSPQALNRLGWELDARPGKLAELPPFPQLPDTPERKRLGKQHGHHFIHSRFHRLNPVADVRHSVCCCLSLDEPPDGPLEPTIQALELLAVVELGARAREPIKKFSGGMKRRLNIAIGLIHRPELLLLDEPTVGIDVQAKVNILDIIRSVGQQGTSVVFTTHQLSEVEQTCTRIAIMDKGTILAAGTLAVLLVGAAGSGGAGGFGGAGGGHIMLPAWRTIAPRTTSSSRSTGISSPLVRSPSRATMVAPYNWLDILAILDGRSV